MNNKKKLITIIISLILLIVIVKFGYGYLSGEYMPIDATNGNSSTDYKSAPDFEVYNEDGNAIKLSDFKGEKPVVVNIWASWCGPCKAEMPYFENAMEKYGDDVEILMVNLTDGQRETKEKALNYLKENNLNMKIVFDTKFSAANAYAVQAIPRTIFIDRDGNIVKDNKGLIDEKILNDYIKKLIK
ncbi:hypothetical protein CSBG_01941 [Clostridium sp. 7_2_43FAA]|uniref:TlpA family protein disulfide reductase n=1 Tax=Clostridium TaxID=1485 RepID=UPI00019B0413|nr:MULTISPECIES: TlpA disulfide reductase family protein [Clostridium]EEH98315.1 hypothetical protein CSBG_01941 [Clostridium sp. 7_2_43FAA]